MENIQEEHFRLGQDFQEQNRLDEALKEYRESIEIGFREDISLKLIQLYRLMQKWECVEERVALDLKSVPKNNVFFRNILLNELEIARGKTVLESRIRSFTVTLTNRCNLNCLACEAKRYNWDIPYRIINEVIEHLPYLEYIMWQGGEVFLLDYFKDILDEARRYPQIKQLIVTNGMLLSEELIEALVVLPDLVLAISVDGATRDVYEKIRWGASFNKLIENIGTINSMRKNHNSSLRLHLNVTVMKSNYRQLPDFIEFANAYGFYSILLRPVQGNRDNAENIFFHKDKEALDFISENIDEVIGRAQKYKIMLDNRILSTNHAHTGQKDKKTNDAGLLCFAPWQRLYISWGGNVYPDCMCMWPPDQGIANVSGASIKDIWNNEGMQVYRKKLIENDYRDICSPDCISGNVPRRYLLFNK